MLASIDGLEIFIHNRSVAYDNILQTLNKLKTESTASDSSDSVDTKKYLNTSLRYRQRPNSDSTESSNGSPPLSEKPERDNKQDTSTPINSSGSTLSFLLRFLPLKVRVKRGAVLMGNVSTPTIMVASYKYASGIIDITKAPNPADNFRVLHNFTFDKFQIFLKTNISYDASRCGGDKTSNNKQTYHYKGKPYIQQFERSLGALKNITDKLLWRRKGPKADNFPQDEWKGLRRYIDNQGDDNVLRVFNDEEYAKNSLILDTLSSRINYYYDSPGCVGYSPLDPYLKDFPEHGVEMELSMATINYGPWADKQRIPLQNMFFPSLYRNSEPTNFNVPPTLLREYSGLKVNINVKDELVIRIPTREPSKDKELLRTNIQNTAKLSRSFGWLELKMKEGSNISQFTSYIATEKEGWANKLSTYFNDLEIRTSVNHDILFKADNHEMNADIGFPLKWNGTPHWTFDNVSTNAQLFFLREHLMLFSDIFSDFATGEPTPYELFKPIVYKINWEMNDYKFYLNVNDQNIINNPLDFNNNTYLSFQGTTMDMHISIPLDGPLSKSTTVSYNILTPRFELVLNTPPWHTVEAFMKGSKVIGSSDNFTIKGSYTYFDLIEINTSNFTEIRCLCDNISLIFYGFAIKYLFIVRENYFGDTIHFKNFEEYTNGGNKEDIKDSASHTTESGSSVDIDDRSDSIDYWKILKTDNDDDIFFSFQIRHGLAILPYYTYDCKSHFGLSFDYCDIDVRFTNYYMDFQADFSPITGVFVDGPDKFESDTIHNINAYKQLYLEGCNQISIDGLSIHAHRMFGIPPLEITYNAKWDFSSGPIEIKSSSKLVIALMTSIKNFAFGFIDFENNLNVPEPHVYDSFNITYRCPSISLMLTEDDDEILTISINDLLASHMDYPNIRYSSRSSVLIPSIILEVIKYSGGLKRIVAHLKTSLNLTNFCQKYNLDQVLKMKQEHLHLNDAPFHRNPYLLFEEIRDKKYNDAYGCLTTSLSLPSGNYPLFDWNINTESGYHDIPSSYEENSNEFFPTNYYDDEDFTPSYDVNQDMEYDSFVFEFSEIEVMLTPSAPMILLKLLTFANEFTFESLVDQLQFEIVTNLRKLMNEIHETKNFRVVIPEVSVKFGKFEYSDSLEIGLINAKVPVYNLVLTEASFVISLEEKKAAKEHLINLESKLSIAFLLKEAFLSISNPELDFHLPLFVSIEGIEFWGDGYNFVELVGSPTVENITFDVHNSQVTWLLEYSYYLYNEVLSAINLFQHKAKKSKEVYAEFVYMLTIASTTYQINHDPEVLTKPAYILRTKKDHVRYYDGWKVMVRLMHIFDTLPESWKEKQKLILLDTNWKLPATAYEDVKNIFSKWRGWEANEDQRVFFFNHIFSVCDKSLKKLMILNSMLELIKFRVLSSNKQMDYLNLRKVSLVCECFSEDNKSFDRFGFEILDTLTDITSSIDLRGISLHISKITLDMILEAKKIIMKYSEDKFGNCEDKDEGEETEKQSFNVNVSTVLNINKYDVLVDLPSCTFKVEGTKSRSSIESFILRDLVGSSILMSSRSDHFEASILRHHKKLFSLPVRDFSITVANFGSTVEGTKVCDIGIESLNVKVLDHDLLLDLLQSLRNNELEQFSAVNRSEETEVLNARERVSPLNNLPDFSVQLSIQHLAFVVELLFPLTMVCEFQGFEAATMKVDNTVSLSSYIRSTHGHAKIGNILVLEYQCSETKVDSKINTSVDELLITLYTSVGYSKIHIPQLGNSLSAYLSNEKVLFKRVENLQNVFRSTHSEVTKPKPNNTKFNYLLRLKSKIDYFGLSTFVNQSKFSFEFEESSLGIYNIDNILQHAMESSYVKVPIFGEMVIQSIRFNILDKSIPMSLSHIFELNVTTKIFNSAEATSKLQTLQVKVQFCRICLSANALFKMLAFLEPLVLFAKTMEKSSLQPNISHKKEGFDIFSRFSSIQVLCYNFCVGWILEASRKDYPGVIIGAERFFLVSEKALGKYTLMEAYVAVANGSRSSNFFSTGSQKNTLNRAYLPRMQLIYSIQEKDGLKNMHVFVNGDEVDVKFLSNSVVMVEQLVSSINGVQAFLKHRSLTSIQMVKKKELSVQKKTPFSSPFHVIEFQAQFAGSKILFCHMDDPEPSSPGSLLLESPAIMIAALYKHNKLSAKKHTVKLDILTSSSENVVYSSCVPIVVELFTGIKSMMKKSSLDQVEAKVSQGLDLGEMFSDVDLQLGIKIEKQTLTLSCEPTAKVAAIVGIEGIQIQVNSHTMEVPTIFATVSFDQFATSLQHIYSREISGSAKIENILVSSSLEFGKVQTLLTSGNMINPEGYINMKQYQDLELFKDIWFPKQYFETQVRERKASISEAPRDLSDLATNKSISNRFKEVSTTYAFPWVITFIMSNTKLQVDFGQSLGKFNLQLDNMWLVSRKSSNWSQELQIGLDRIALESAGRLGGNFEANNINLHTAIAWKLGSTTTLDVPLILISGGIDKLSLKLSFDYHVFALAYILGLSMDVFNQKNEVSISKDHLLVKFNCVAAEAYATSLTASNLWNIQNTISRMIQEKRRSYKETLRDSSATTLKPELRRTLTDDILETVKKLESNILLTFGHLLIYIYPSSFDDSKVLVLKLDESRAYFQQNEYLKGISNELEIKFNDMAISLSKTEEVLEKFINTCSVEEFIVIAHKAQGGNIFMFPSFKISMRTFQKYKNHIVEYLYQSSFGGTVDIRWNLGSVNFIREMIAIHNRALESRTSYYRTQERGGEVGPDLSINNENIPSSPLLKQSMEETDPTDKIEQAIEERITKVAQESKYTYVPIAPPIIAAPQLKELGNATPPLEWFGLHRNKFPNVTHQIAIVSLQKLIHEVELQYSKLLGKA
jgi:hypothetical protein